MVLASKPSSMGISSGDSFRVGCSRASVIKTRKSFSRQWNLNSLVNLRENMIYECLKLIESSRMNPALMSRWITSIIERREGNILVIIIMGKEMV